MASKEEKEKLPGHYTIFDLNLFYTVFIKCARSTLN